MYLSIGSEQIVFAQLVILLALAPITSLAFERITIRETIDAEDLVERLKLPAAAKITEAKIRTHRQQVFVRLKSPAGATAINESGQILGGHALGTTSKIRRKWGGQLREHKNQLQSEQAAFMNRCLSTAPGTVVLGSVQTLLNGVFLEIDTKYLYDISKDPAVRQVSTVKNYRLHLSETVPHIGASVSRSTGIDGRGVRIAILDSGIDYTHAKLGGPGTLEAYENAYGTDLTDPRNTRIDELFPTSKVIGGVDFIGELWDPTNPNSPPLMPDEDPIDRDGHGTHVADIVAGKNGVAPGATLYAVKVCSSVSSFCSGIALIKGMEFAVDPNGDGDTSDAVDIINMSLGAPYGQSFDDDLSTAVDNASNLGVLTVASAGNGSDKPYVTGSPASAVTALSVAQTHVPSAMLQFMEVIEPVAEAENYRAVFQPWSAPLSTIREGQVTYGDGMGGNLDGCAEFTVPLSGIVLVDRGECFFTTKVRNIQNAGGELGLIGLISSGEPFAGGYADGSPITIPAFMLNRTDAEILRFGNATVQFDPSNVTPLVLSMVGSSSRGPAMQDNLIKPEIGAPGASISAEAGTGTSETAFGGTSGAAPMVTGAAALLMQTYRDVSGVGPAEIKQLLVNTANREIANSAPDHTLAPITRIGGGEVRVNQALETPAVMFDTDQPEAGGLSFGFHDVTNERLVLNKNVSVRNLSSNQAINYEVTTSFRFENDQENGAITLSTTENTVNVAPGETAQFDLTLEINGELLKGNSMNVGSQGDNSAALTENEYDGYVTLTSPNVPTLHLPWNIQPRKASRVVTETRRLNFNSTGQGVIDLNNNGVGPAQISAFSLLALSDNLPSGKRGEQMPTPDIRAVGVNSFIVPSTVCSSNFIWTFAINTWERQTHLVPVSHQVWLETTQDGSPDYVILNRDSSFTNVTAGQQLSWVFNLSDSSAEALFFAEHATNSSNTILYLCGEQVGLSATDLARTNVDAFFIAEDFYFGGLGDIVSGLTITPLGERYFALVEDVPAHSNDFMDVIDFGPFTGNTEEHGIVLFSDGDRGPGNRGGATADSEALIFLTDPSPYDEATFLER